MITLREKAIALTVVCLLNFSVLVLGPIYLFFSAPVSALFAAAVLRA